MCTHTFILTQAMGCTQMPVLNMRARRALAGAGFALLKGPLSRNLSELHGSGFLVPIREGPAALHKGFGLAQGIQDCSSGDAVCLTASKASRTTADRIPEKQNRNLSWRRSFHSGWKGCASFEILREVGGSGEHHVK